MNEPWLPFLHERYPGTQFTYTGEATIYWDSGPALEEVAEALELEHVKPEWERFVRDEIFRAAYPEDGIVLRRSEKLERVLGAFLTALQGEGHPLSDTWWVDLLLDDHSTIWEKARPLVARGQHTFPADVLGVLLADTLGSPRVASAGELSAWAHQLHGADVAAYAQMAEALRTSG